MRNLVLNPISFSHDIDDFFNSFFSPNCKVDHQVGFAPKVNILENKDNVTLTFELPGMEKGDIKVLVEDNQLTVSGERKLKDESEEDNLVRTEIRNGSFTRSFTLPDYVDPTNIQADYKNGLLEIGLPKKEESKPKQIEVSVK